MSKIHAGVSYLHPCFLKLARAFSFDCSHLGVKGLPQIRLVFAQLLQLQKLAVAA